MPTPSQYPDRAVRCGLHARCMTYSGCPASSIPLLNALSSSNVTPRIRSGRAARTAASNRDRRTAQNDRGPATPDRPIKFEEPRKQHGATSAIPSACPDVRFGFLDGITARKRIALAISAWETSARSPTEGEREDSYRAPLSFHQLQDQRVRISCMARSSFDP